MINLKYLIKYFAKNLHLDEISIFRDIYYSIWGRNKQEVECWLEKEQIAEYSIKYEGYDLYCPFKYKKRWQEHIGESDVKECIEKLVSPGDIVVDIGGHLGRSTIVLHNQVKPTGCVIVFEPVPVWAQYLNETIDRNNLNSITVEKKQLLQKLEK